MQSEGLAGRAQLSPSTRQLLAAAGTHELRERGSIAVKGLAGQMTVFWLEGLAASRLAEGADASWEEDASGQDAPRPARASLFAMCLPRALARPSSVEPASGSAAGGQPPEAEARRGSHFRRWVAKRNSRNSATPSSAAS